MTKKKRCKGGLPVLPELLAPAGNLEKLVTAVHYGADAVYLAGKSLSLRAAAGNFSEEEMAQGITFAHTHGCKVYVAVNVLAHNDDMKGLEEYLQTLSAHEIDGLIVADPGILAIAAKTTPHIPIHLSTQANVTNSAAARFWFDQGISRINLARELCHEEIVAIRDRTSGEIEVFVHGALCISYSGRCMLSNYLTARDANRGDCSHPCRYSYQLVEEKRPGQFFAVEEDSRGTYIFNSKDLCLLPRLPQLLAAGVDSLKIEGRMKSIFYVGGVVRIYRAALDYLAGLPLAAWKDPETIILPAQLLEEVRKIGTRATTENFFLGKPTAEDMLYETSRAEQTVEPVAVIRDGGPTPLVEIRNRLRVGELIEYMGRGMVLQPVVVEAMYSEKKEHHPVANPGNRVYLHTRPELKDCEVHGILRRRRNPTEPVS